MYRTGIAVCFRVLFFRSAFADIVSISPAVADSEGPSTTCGKHSRHTIFLLLLCHPQPSGSATGFAHRSHFRPGYTGRFILTQTAPMLSLPSLFRVTICTSHSEAYRLPTTLASYVNRLTSQLTYDVQRDLFPAFIYRRCESRSFILTTLSGFVARWHGWILPSGVQSGTHRHQRFHSPGHLGMARRHVAPCAPMSAGSTALGSRDLFPWDHSVPTIWTMATAWERSPILWVSGCGCRNASLVGE